MTRISDGFGSTALRPRRRRRRRSTVVVGCVVLLVLATAAALALRTRDADSRRGYLSTNGWPERGQGAYHAMTSTPSYRLPVAGTVANTNTLLGQDGFVGMKTGSHDAAGGCLMFRTYRSVQGDDTELIGVVLGQRGDNLINAGLYAARQLADRIAPTPAHPR